MRTVLASMAFLGVAACDAPAPAPPSPIALKTPLAVTDGQPGVTYGQVTSSAAVIDTASAPAPFETLVADTTCRQPRYRSGAKVAYVHLYGGQIRAPLQFVNLLNTNGKVERPWRIDVMVTETKAPVFLYLSSYDPVLWNIQLAPGAKLDGVVLNSYHPSMIANGTDPARTAIASFDRSPAPKCYSKPPMEEGGRRMQTFDSDMLHLLGKRPDWTITRSPDGYQVKGVLVGPPPPAPIAPQPITRLQIVSHINAAWGERKLTRDEEILGNF